MTQEQIEEIIKEFEDIKFFSDGATLDRATKILEKVTGAEIASEISEETMQNLDAQVSDSSKKRVVVDPVLNIAKGLLELYDGRTESLELFSVKEDDLAKAQEIVSAYRRANRPLISVDFQIADSKEEVIGALERMLTSLKGDEPEFSEFDGDTDHHRETFYTMSRCSTHNWTTKPYWEERADGRYLLEKRCTQTICSGGCGGDYLCKIGPEGEGGQLLIKTAGPAHCTVVVIWKNTDASTEPPSGSTIPNFEPIAWNHCVDFFSDTSLVSALTSRFGWRRLGSRNDFHPGIDIAAPVGTPVYSVAGGVVDRIFTVSAPSSPEKQGVWVRSGGMLRKYWHLIPAPTLVEGMPIGAGELVGSIVQWNSPTAHHLHFAQYNTGASGQPSDGNAVDPIPNCGLF
ncbi:Peptidase family M23 [Yoonia rosea]|uniref:Peptidase family M23 n=1 Tax=Yoonia rosea TaxID=287098 RepID=A0A1R3X2C6_9RHOB|nr:M23 family metallopeptidase [Yoonia rosea]SIT85064.1 Peptidase family M23 [Yoonia rosea]